MFIAQHSPAPWFMNSGYYHQSPQFQHHGRPRGYYGYHNPHHHFFHHHDCRSSHGMRNGMHLFAGLFLRNLVMIFFTWMSVSIAFRVAAFVFSLLLSPILWLALLATMFSFGAPSCFFYKPCSPYRNASSCGRSFGRSCPFSRRCDGEGASSSRNGYCRRGGPSSSCGGGDSVRRDCRRNNNAAQEENNSLRFATPRRAALAAFLARLQDTESSSAPSESPRNPVSPNATPATAPSRPQMKPNDISSVSHPEPNAEAPVNDTSSSQEEAAATANKTIVQFPTYHLAESSDSMTVSVEVPGFQQSELEVTMDANAVLFVSGSRSNNNGDTILFKRKFIMDKNKTTSDLDVLKADLSLGVLKVTVPKKEKKEIPANKPQIIPIAMANKNTMALKTDEEPKNKNEDDDTNESLPELIEKNEDSMEGSVETVEEDDGDEERSVPPRRV